MELPSEYSNKKLSGKLIAITILAKKIKSAFNNAQSNNTSSLSHVILSYNLIQKFFLLVLNYFSKVDWNEFMFHVQLIFLIKKKNN